VSTHVERWRLRGQSSVRYTAVEVLCKLEHVVFTSHAAAIVSRMRIDSNARVRHSAVEALGKLDQVALTLHAGAIAEMILDLRSVVRYAALLRLAECEPSALTSHAGAIVGMLADSYSGVRFNAVMVLSQLEPLALTSHTGTILAMLADPDSGVRYSAIQLLRSESMGMHTSAVLALGCSAVTNVLADKHYMVRCAARTTLGILKRKLARLHWATARVQVRLVRPYALFWDAYVGKQLCAPGGKWAERDRVAFEEEFVALHEELHL